MKKFISFVMAGAMVASLVPATAFAKGDVSATAKIVDAKEMEKGQSAVFDGDKGPELQIKVGSADYSSDVTPTLEFDVDLEDAEFAGYDSTKSDSYNAGIIRDLVDIDFDDAGIFDGGVYNGTSTSTTQYVEESNFANAVGIAKNDAGVIDQSTFISKSTYSALVLKGDDLKEALMLAGYASNAQGDYTIDQANLPKTVNAFKTYGDITFADSVDEALYTATEVNTGIEVKDLKTVVDDDITANHAGYVYVKSETTSTGGGDITGDHVALEVKDVDKDSVTLKFYGKFHKDDKIIMDLKTKLTKTSEGTKATVSVDSKAVTVDDLVFASILGKGFKASVKKTVDVAEDERVVLNSSGLKIEAAVGNLPKEVTLKINSGFEFTDRNSGLHGTGYTISKGDDDKELIVTVADGYEDITIKDIEIEAVSAKSGAVATITAKASNNDSASCEVAKVVDYKVSLTVDADEDLPVIFSGTDVENAGITDDSDHLSLEVTAKESFPGAWSMRQGFNFNLPEGVYVTNVKNIDAENFFQDGRDLDKEGTKANTSYNSDQAWQDAFFNAYQDGDHKNFEFKKRVFDDVNTNVTDNDPAEITFQLELVADPTFEGDVKLALEGPLVDKQEVTIAKFVKPYTVKAEQNDVIIDYRNTEVKTPIVITEAEEGLWKKDATFKLNIEDDLLTFEDDPTFTIDSDSDLTLKDDKTTKGTIQFAVKEESDKAASVTISDMKLFMSRSIPAGAYDLEIATTMSEAYDKQLLFAPDAIKSYTSETAYENAMKDLAKEDGWKNGDRDSNKVKKDSYVDDVCDYSDVVKAAFINVVTSGRDNDNLFTTKVVVPVGEAYLLAGEAKVELDAPAYISAAGYTMLPVRAISKALGVNTNNVLWNAETRTVTVMYAQRIITMTVGQKSVYVNGSPIPTSAAPEIKDGRTFLPLRDLGTALGVTNVNWDAATKTATLN